MGITSPVARTLEVRDVAASAAFYRDVLGFRVRESGGAAEAESGPAAVRLERGEGEAGVVFFQVRDVEAARAAIVERGGKAGAIERVNWIKMRMFEVRDPDGNVLWFGQSFHVEQDSPSRRDGQPKGMRQALPAVAFDDVGAAVAYYRDVLGFRINYQQDDLGVMDRDAITVLLIRRDEGQTGSGSFEVYVDDVDALYEEMAAKGAEVSGAPVSHPWGLRDFRVTDVGGNRITFAQTFE